MQQLSIDKSKFDLADAKEMAKDIFSEQAKDFSDLKNQKWYHRLLNAITFGAMDKKYMVRNVRSMAKLQELFVRIYHQEFQKSDEEFDRLVESVITTNQSVKKIYEATIVNIQPQEDLKSLNDTDQQYLLLLLGEYEPFYCEENLFQEYKRNVARHLNKNMSTSNLSYDKLSLVANPKPFYRCILELSALDGTLRSEEFPENIYDALDHLNLSQVAKNDLKQSVEKEEKVFGKEYFLEKYGSKDLEMESVDDFKEVEQEERISSRNDEDISQLSDKPVVFGSKNAIEKTKEHRGHKIGLVFAGGAARGAYQIGIWKALREKGLDRDVGAVSGTSVGGLNAALFLQGDYEKAEEAWLSISNEIILSKKSLDEVSSATNRQTKGGLYGRSGLIDIIKDYLDMDVFDHDERNCYITCVRSKLVKDREKYVEWMNKKDGSITNFM